MSESKELLEATIKGLKEKVEQATKDLQTKQKELGDVNKPGMASEMFDTLEQCVIEGIDVICDTLESDDMEVEYGIEYDGRVYLDSINFNDTQSMVDRILTEINNKFKIIE